MVFAGEKLFAGGFPDIKEQSDEQLRAEIETKFGPIPEFDEAGFNDEFIHFPEVEEILFGITRPSVKTPRYRFSYNTDKTHLSFVDHFGKPHPGEIIEYVLLDEDTQTVARRKLYYEHKSNPYPQKPRITITDNLSSVEVSYRIPQYTQTYSVRLDTVRHSNEVHGINVDFHFDPQFGDFDRIRSSFAAVSFDISEDKPRTRITLPIDSMSEIIEAVTEEGYRSNTYDMKLWMEQGRQEDPVFKIPKRDEDIIYISTGLGEFDALVSGKPYTTKGYNPRILTVNHTADNMNILLASRGKRAEVWEVNFPDYPDVLSIAQQMIGPTQAWTGINTTLPVQLDIHDKQTLTTSKKK